MTTETKPKPEPIVRVPYTEIEDAKQELNEEGLLTGIPAKFDSKYHLKPKSEDFADQADFFEWQANMAQESASSWVAKAESYRKRAETCRLYGNDPATRASMLRREKLLANLEALDEKLLEQGVDVEALDAAAESEAAA